MIPAGTRILVTGAGGFLGGALVRGLCARGHAVRALVRRPTDVGDAEVVLGDLRDPESLARACRGIDLVFHTAAKAGGWGDPAEYEAVNVGGTEALLAAAREAGVRAFVYTSSPSVVFDGRPIEGGDERLPYARRFLADYPRTKAIAERLVLRSEGVPTISLRPHLIWGPGDRHLLPRLVARAGKLKRVGSGDPLTDTTYVDNCVHAHLLAGARLLEDPERVSGKAYFVSDGAPVGLWTMANHLLRAAGAPEIRGRIPGTVARVAAGLLEGWHRLTRNPNEPLVTRFAVEQFLVPQWYDISAARRDLGYAPVVSLDEGLAALRRHLQTSA